MLYCSKVTNRAWSLCDRSSAGTGIWADGADAPGCCKASPLAAVPLWNTGRASRTLSDYGGRSEANGKSRSFFRSFEVNSGDYLTINPLGADLRASPNGVRRRAVPHKTSGKMDRFPATAVDHSIIRQPPRLQQCRLHIATVHPSRNRIDIYRRSEKDD